MVNHKINTNARAIFLNFIVVFALYLSTCNALAEESYPTLWDSEDAQLHDQLVAVVKEKGLWSQVENGRLSLVLVDISDMHHPRVAAIRGDIMFYAASLPKIAILLAAFVQIEQNKLELNESLMKDMTAMIRYSNNAAATRVLSLVGRDELLVILQSFKFRLYDPEHGGGLWVGKDFAKAGAYKRDPIKNLSHAATAMQAARFYYLLQTNRLVGPELTKKMKEILSRPAIAHKFVKGLKSTPEVKVYRKSGTWRQYHADSALIESDYASVIMVGLAKHPDGGKWLTSLAKPIFNLVVNNRINEKKK